MVNERDAWRAMQTAVDPEFWVDMPSLGSIIELTADRPDETPSLLVPDGAGGYKDHRPRANRRLGFRVGM